MDASILQLLVLQIQGGGLGGAENRANLGGALRGGKVHDEAPTPRVPAARMHQQVTAQVVAPVRTNRGAGRRPPGGGHRRHQPSVWACASGLVYYKHTATWQPINVTNPVSGHVHQVWYNINTPPHGSP
jgi:hypothetical protein